MDVDPDITYLIDGPPKLPTKDRDIRMPPQVGRYQLERLLGRGGMGAVFLATDPKLGRRVAIKLLHEDATTQRRLIREARAIARVHHPNVVAVYDVDEFHEPGARPCVFMVMEYVEGMPLHAWLEAGRSSAAILDVFMQAGRGLVAAHACGLVHRDFKPANVLVDRSDHAHVVDFGLARTNEILLLEASHGSKSSSSGNEDPLEDVTQTNSILGTPRYMSPEQHGGDPLDARTDQYSFCLSLFVALTGRYPFPSRPAKATLRAKLQGKVATDALPISKRARAAIRRGLAARPEERWDSMSTLLDQLRPRRRKWPTFAVLGALTVLTPVAASSLGNDSQTQTDRCDAEQAFMDEMWSAEAVDTFEHSLRGSVVGAASIPFVTAQLERQATALRNARVKLCAAELSPAQHLARQACLEQQRNEFSKVVRRISANDQREMAPDLLALLAPPDECDPTGVDVIQMSDRRQLQRFFTLKVLIAESEHDAALLVHQRLLTELRASNDRRLLAETLLQGTLLLQDLDARRDAASEALGLAEELGRDDIAIRALLARVSPNIGGNAALLDRAQHDLDLANAKVMRMHPSRADLIAQVRQHEVKLCSRRQYEKQIPASSCFALARASIQASSASPLPLQVATINTAAYIHLSSGDTTRAQELVSSSIATVTEAMGSRHPLLERSLMLQAQIDSAHEDPQAALDHLTEALSIVDAFGGRRSPRASAMLLSRGSTRMGIADYEGAYEDFRQVAEFGAPRSRLPAARNAAISRYLAGHFEATLLEIDDILLAERKSEPRNSIVRTEVLSLRGEVLMRLGRLDEAVGPARAAAVELEASPNAHPFIIARVLMVAAQVLHAHGDEKDARSFLARATHVLDSATTHGDLHSRFELIKAIIEDDTSTLRRLERELVDPISVHLLNDAEQALARIESH